MVLCGSSFYTKKFYLAPEFDVLPKTVKDELKIMCVLFTEEVGGVISLEFDEEGELFVRASADEDDILYDDIGARLKAKELRPEHEELFEELELYYRVQFM